MSTSDDPVGDDALAAAIRDVATPVPERLKHLAMGAYAWRTIDADLASLVESELVRSSTAVSTFEFADVSIAVEIAPVADGQREISVVVDGLAEPSIAVRTSDGRELPLDAQAATGSITLAARGLVRVAVRRADGTEILTPWIDL